MKFKILFYWFVLLVVGCDEKNKTSTSDESLVNLQTKEKLKSLDNFSEHSTSSSIIDLKDAVEQLDNAKGLSNSSVNTIFQDSENLIWIGTWDGLNRYDGNKFKIFRPDINNENSLSNHVILKIDEDDVGGIWVLTMHGINRYDKKTNVFQPYYFSRKNKPPLSEWEFNIALDSSKKVFCAVKDWGIGYFNDNNFQQLNSGSLPSGNVKKMEFTSSDELLVLYENNKLFSLKIESIGDSKKKLSHIKLISDKISDFGVLQNQKIILISNLGVSKIYSLVTQREIILDNKHVEKIIGYVPEGVVVSTKKGYFIVDEMGISLVKSSLKHLKNQKITTLTKGTENVLWAGTDGDGIFKIFPISKSFNMITKVQVPELDGGIVRTFSVVNESSFWVGTKGKGLIWFSSNLFLDPNEPLKYNVFNENNSGINNSVFAIHNGDDNLVFIGSDGAGINVYDITNSKLINWEDIINSNKADFFKSIYTIYQDQKGFIWLGSYGYGMIQIKLERTGDKLKLTHFKKYQARNRKEDQLSSNIVFSIIPRNEEELWIGTRLGGLNLFNKNTGSFKNFKNEKDNHQSLSNNDILCLFTDNNNKLWIGTSFGLNLMEEYKNDGSAVFKNYTVKDGLPNNTIHGIQADENANLWLSTNLGLSNFIINKSQFINYINSDGLQNNEFSDGAAYKDEKTGVIFMGGIKGFNFFLPSEIVESNYMPDLLIDKISEQYQDLPYYQNLLITPSAYAKPSIVLDHNQNFFDIELTALTFINTEKCQYAYQLKNFDQDWNFIGNRRNISFTNVPPGNYILNLKWTNSDGVWSDEIEAINIKIKPIFWLSNIAIGFYTLFIILFILFVRSYFKERQLLKQNIIFRKKDEEIHQNKLNFFTNVAHELQTPLSLIVGPVQKLVESQNIDEKNKKFIHMIQRNSSRLLFLTQQLLEFRKAELDHLEVSVKEFDLVNLIEQIAELFDDWALNKYIDFKVEVPSELVGWYDKDKIEKIIFNLLSNAFKYTPQNGKIAIQLFLQKEDSTHLTLKVINTGKGIQKDKLNQVFNRFFLNQDINDSNMFRTGIGLAYVKSLVTVLNGEISVASKENEITTFTVYLPCAKEKFSENQIDNEVKQILISHHLKNILEDNAKDIENVPNKISSIDFIENPRKLILVVEDELEIHNLLNELLKEKYKILKAFNGLEALEIVNNQLPDLIISDVKMPFVDGLELCEKIKSDVKTSHIPFIMLTANDSVIHRIEGLEKGANSYIPKPFHPDHLLIRVEKLLQEKELILKYLHKDNFVENISNLQVNNEEKEFIKKITDLIRENIENEDLQSAFIEKELGISNSQLYRKTKQIFGFSPGDLIRTIRLKYAAELLSKNTLTVSEVCYKSGFNNRSYFYREFNKMYNITPKNYQLKSKL